MSNELKSRTKKFAHCCVKLALSLPNHSLANHIKSQLIRSATSTAANYRAACLAQSKKSFVAKLSISIEEVDESNFWIEFALEENLVELNNVKSIIDESKQLTSIFIASRKTAQNSINH